MNRPYTMQELKHAPRDELSTINQELLPRSSTVFVNRLRPCAASYGGHLQDIIYQK
jgi:hypothetical protein